MKKVIVYIVLLASLSIENCLAQNVITARIKGTPVINDDRNIVEGTPFLYAEFKSGTLFINNSKTEVGNLQVRLNLMTNQVSYKDNNVELMPNDPVLKFVIFDGTSQHVFQKGLPEIDKWDTNTYYEVLNTSGLPLVLKKHIKTLLSSKQYNSSKTTDTYLNNVKYYAYTAAGEMLKFSTDEKGYSKFFPGRENEMMSWVKQNKINVKSDQGLKSLFEHYSKVK